MPPHTARFAALLSLVALGLAGCLTHRPPPTTSGHPTQAPTTEPTAVAPGVWDALGLVEFNELPRHPSVVRDGEDYILAFGVETGTAGSHEGRVMRLTDGQWRPLGAPMPGVCSSLAIDFESDRTTEGGSLYMVHDSTTLRRWTGSTWEDVGGAGRAAPEGSWLAPASLTFHEGAPYLTWVAQHPNSSPVEVHRWDGAVFRDVGDQPLISSGVARRNNLVFDSRGVAYTAFLDQRERVKRAQVMAFDGRSWHALPRPAVTTGGTWSDLLLYVHDDELFVAYIDSRRTDGAATSHGMPVVVRFDGEQWRAVGVPDFNQGDDVGFLEMNVSPSGEVFVAFEDRGRTGGGSGFAVTVMRYREGAWSNLGARRFSPGIPKQLLFDRQGNPVVLVKTGNVSTSRKTLSLHRFRLVP